MGIIRYAITFLIGLIAAWVTASFTELGFSAEDAERALSGLEIILTFLVAFISSKALKRGAVGKAIDPGAYADVQWKKMVAPEVRRLPADEVKRRLANGTLESSTAVAPEKKKYPLGY